jgi:hypothetical protein
MDIDQRDVEDLLAAHLEDLRQPGVLSVRPGYELTNGWLTGRRAVVVTVAKKLESPPPGQALPDMLGAIPVDVRQASPRKRQSLQDPEAYAQARRLAPNRGAVPQFADEQAFVDGAVAPVAVVHPASTLPPKPQLPYTAAPDTPLAAVHAGMTIHLAASPDSGWPTLRGFLGDVSSELTAAPRGHLTESHQSTPIQHGRTRYPDHVADLGIRHSIGGQQQHLGSLHHSMR